MSGRFPAMRWPAGTVLAAGALLAALGGCTSAPVTLSEAQDACADQLAHAQISDIRWRSDGPYKDSGRTVSGRGLEKGQRIAVSCEVAGNGTVLTSTSSTP